MAEVTTELEVLTEMNANAMPVEVIAEQQKRIVNIQFAGAESRDVDELNAAIDELVQERKRRQAEEATTPTEAQPTEPPTEPPTT